MLKISDLHEYQRRAVKHVIENTHSALFLEMGLGKTVSTLTALNILIYEELEINNVLIIAPKRVAESVWDAEINNWEHLKNLTCSKIIGTAKQRRAALQKPADIYLLGRDNVPWLCGQFGGSALPFDMLVIDELSSFKNPKSIRFKALKGVQPSFKRVVGLTGTPAPNSLADIWSQIYLLDRGARLGKFVTNFRDNYLTPDKRNGATVYSYKVGEKATETIQNKISDICISMKSKDYLDLPERISNNILINMPPNIEVQYREFEKEQVLSIFAEIETETETETEAETETETEIEVDISAVNAAALSNKLLQFANGAVYDEDKKYHEVHRLKLDVLKEIVEDANGEPVLIAWTYRHDLARMKEALKKYEPVELKTDQDIKDWNAGKIKVMMMHPASGGHGLNLQAGGNIIVHFGQTWSLELEQQFNARLDRQGQKKAVIINKLVVKGTLDQDVIEAQRRKSDVQNGLMNAVKARIEKYLKK